MEELSTELSTRPASGTFAVRYGAPMGWFKHWFGTRYYALLYGHRDEEDAQAWVAMITGRWALPPGARILDLACGRGRHARGFAEAGLQVTGVDISESSIQEAQLAVPKGEFLVHDMREPFRPGTFDAVCCLFTSLGYFEDLADDHKVFEAVAVALKPGGLFVLDFMNTELVLRDLVAMETVAKDGVEFKVTRTLSDGVLVKRITVSDGCADHVYEERVQALTPAQLEEMARSAGFIIEDRTDGPELLPFDPQHSHRYVLWMRRSTP
jgi:SAM-dependent methyltransferase